MNKKVIDFIKSNLKILVPAILGVGLIIMMIIPKNIVSDIELSSVDSLPPSQDTVVANEIEYKYGLVTNEYTIKEDIVKRNESFSVILSRFGITPSQVYEISKKSKGIINLRKIRSGNPYTVFISKDSIPKPVFFVYENSIKDYTVFDLRGDINVYKGKNSSEKREKTVKGVVKSSLWNSVEDAGANPILAVKISEIFAWTIDFFGVAPDDEFKILYDQEYIEGKPINSYTIKGVYFKNRGSEYYAIRYKQNSKTSYYDENGANLQKAFLKAPLDFYRISSKFSNRRFHPVLKRYRAHHGVDYAAPTGTPIHAVGDGRIIARAYQPNGGGYYLKIKHNSVYTTIYMHLSKYAKGMVVGNRVKQRQVIGYVGATGLATGPHLDFRVYKNGTPINPLNMKSIPKESIKAKDMQDFKKHRDEILNKLK